MSAQTAWSGAEAYERFMGRWSALVAERFLAWLEPEAGARWVDVGCGTGALTGAILAHAVPAEVLGIDPSPAFVAAAAERHAGAPARFLVADAEHIPAGDGELDRAVSGLVLNFVPDPAAAAVEIRRAVRSGGAVAAYVWDYGEGMQLLRAFWDAAAELDPDASRLDEGARFGIARRDGVAEVFAAAGLEDVEVTAIEIPTRFESFEDFWAPFLGGQGPAGGFVRELTDEGRAALRAELERRLPREAGGAIPLTARAWATRARVPA